MRTLRIEIKQLLPVIPKLVFQVKVLTCGFCSSGSSLRTALGGVSYSDTKGFTIARGGYGSTNHTTGSPITTSNLSSCIETTGHTTPTTNQMEHVETKQDSQR